MAIIMKGLQVAKEMRSKNRGKAEYLIKNNKICPKIAFVRVGERPDAVGYQKSATKAMERNSIENEAFVFNESISQEDFLQEFKKINEREDIDGVLLLRPLPEHIDTEKISMLIDPKKDVDGISPYNIGKTFSPTSQDFVPITPVSVIRILEYYNFDIVGKDIVIVGHSLVVGRPLALLLIHSGATVTVCHIDTKDVSAHTKKADIVISATGKKWLITESYIKKGAVVVDVGTTYEDGKVYGDVKFDEVEPIASYINPVPGGIGAITTEILCERVIQAASQRTASF